MISAHLLTRRDFSRRLGLLLPLATVTQLLAASTPGIFNPLEFGQLLRCENSSSVENAASSWAAFQS